VRNISAADGYYARTSGRIDRRTWTKKGTRLNLRRIAERRLIIYSRYGVELKVRFTSRYLWVDSNLSISTTHTLRWRSW
jgi:hypothetical protein